jgi:hypothetical protein
MGSALLKRRKYGLIIVLTYSYKTTGKAVDIHTARDKFSGMSIVKC